MKSSSRILREAPVEVVRGVWAMMASAAQVYSRLEAVEALKLTWSSAHRCICAMSMGKGGRSRTARHELLKMVPNTDSAATLVRACFGLPCTLRGSAPPRRRVGTCVAGVNTTDLLPDVVVSAGEALRSGTTVGEVVLPSWPRERTADAADVSAAEAADFAAAAAAIGAADVDGAVSAVTALDASVVDDPTAGCDLDHRRSAWWSICRGGLAHGSHLQPRFCCRPHGQRLARGLRHPSSLGLTESSPPEQFKPPGLSSRNHFSLHINELHREIEELGRSVLYVLFRRRVLSLDVSLVLSRSRAHEQNIQRQTHLLLSQAIRTLFLPCDTLLLVSQQQFLLAPAMLPRETQYKLQCPLSRFPSLEPSPTLAMP